MWAGHHTLKLVSGNVKASIYGMCMWHRCGLHPVFPSLAYNYIAVLSIAADER